LLTSQHPFLVSRRLCREWEVLAFTSFVRCWVSDEHMLVAGLYNGALQAVHWKTGKKENLPKTRMRHDETCFAATLMCTFLF